MKSRAPENDSGYVPLVRAQVMRYARNTRLGPRYRNRALLTVSNVKELDIFFVHAELQQIVVSRVLIPPDDPYRFYPPLGSERF